jgi:hypothetical protein
MAKAAAKPKLETTIKMIEGETTVLGTNDRSYIQMLNRLGIEVGEESEDGFSYFEIEDGWIQIGKPRSARGTSNRAPMSDEQKAVNKARLVLARAAKDSEWAKRNWEMVLKWATSHPEIKEQYAPKLVVGDPTKASKNGKGTKAAAVTSRKKAPEPEPEPEEEDEAEEAEDEAEEEEPEPAPAPAGKKSGLAGRLKVRR